MTSSSATSEHQRRTLAILASGHPILRMILDDWKRLSLPGAWISGSVVAQAVWNKTFNLPPEYGISDIDVVYFDAADLSEASETNHGKRISHAFPHLPVRLDVKNQARVHLWYESRFGYSIEPYASVEEAVATFPTTSASIGIRPLPWGGLEILAPSGLADLLHPIVKANKKQVTRQIYDAKVAQWRAKWPKLEILAWDEC